MEYFAARVKKEFGVELPTNVREYHSENVVIFKPTVYLNNFKNFFVNYHFCFLTSPPPIIYVDNKELNLAKNHILVSNPGTLVKINSNNTLVPEYYSVSIRREFLECVASSICGKTDILFASSNIRYSRTLIDLLEAFIAESQSQRIGNKLMLECLCMQLAVSLMRNLESNLTSKVGDKTYRDRKRIDRVLEFINEYYGSDIDLKDLCQTADLSPYYFIRVFKAETGKTPHEYLTEVRIRRAKEMLNSGIYKIGEIARMCGFVNQGHFCTVFKKITGETATSYRKKIISMSRSK